MRAFLSVWWDLHITVFVMRWCMCFFGRGDVHRELYAWLTAIWHSDIEHPTLEINRELVPRVAAVGDNDIQLLHALLRGRWQVNLQIDSVAGTATIGANDGELRSFILESKLLTLVHSIGHSHRDLGSHCS